MRYVIDGARGRELNAEKRSILFPSHELCLAGSVEFLEGIRSANGSKFSLLQNGLLKVLELAIFHCGPSGRSTPPFNRKARSVGHFDDILERAAHLEEETNSCTHHSL